MATGKGGALPRISTRPTDENDAEIDIGGLRRLQKHRSSGNVRTRSLGGAPTSAPPIAVAPPGPTPPVAESRAPAGGNPFVIVGRPASSRAPLTPTTTSASPFDAFYARRPLQPLPPLPRRAPRSATSASNAADADQALEALSTRAEPAVQQEASEPAAVERAPLFDWTPWGRITVTLTAPLACLRGGESDSKQLAALDAFQRGQLDDSALACLYRYQFPPPGPLGAAASPAHAAAVRGAVERLASSTALRTDDQRELAVLAAQQDAWQQSAASLYAAFCAGTARYFYALTVRYQFLFVGSGALESGAPSARVNGTGTRDAQFLAALRAAGVEFTLAEFNHAHQRVRVLSAELAAAAGAPTAQVPYAIVQVDGRAAVHRLFNWLFNEGAALGAVSGSRPGPLALDESTDHGGAPSLGVALPTLTSHVTWCGAAVARASLRDRGTVATDAGPRRRVQIDGPLLPTAVPRLLQHFSRAVAPGAAVSVSLRPLAWTRDPAAQPRGPACWHISGTVGGPALFSLFGLDSATRLVPAPAEAELSGARSAVARAGSLLLIDRLEISSASPGFRYFAH